MDTRNVIYQLRKKNGLSQDELAEREPNAKTIQLLSANPLCMTYDKLMPILEMINKYLPKMEYIYACTRVTDIKN
ncbi:MAG: hypothetical protein K6E91_10585 [Butyrivibrio sp.]|nr:hypothetical protein [Butyrivibrio sp.]